jgi:RHS repeat-associated protein
MNSKQDKKVNNRLTYQGQFAEEDDETGYNAFEARLWDNRAARWMAPDPAGKYWSPYLGMGNNGINSFDASGLFDSRFNAWWYSIFHGGGHIGYAKDKGEWFIGNQLEDLPAGSPCTYERVFEGDVLGPVSLGLTFELAIPEGRFNPAMGIGYSFGLIAGYKGFSPYFTSKSLDIDATKFPAQMTLAWDATYYNEYDLLNIYNEDIRGQGWEINASIGQKFGFGWGRAQSKGKTKAKSISITRGLKLGNNKTSLDAGFAVWKTQTTIPFRLNNDFSITNF